VPDRVWQAVGGMRVMTDPIGSTIGFTSDRIHGIEPGSTINVEVAADLSQTWYQVRYASLSDFPPASPAATAGTARSPGSRRP
jgi:hypothetical protein